MLDRLPRDVLRAKGIVRFAGRDWQCLFNFTCGRHELAWVKLRRRVESQAVFIGRDLERHAEPHSRGARGVRASASSAAERSADHVERRPDPPAEQLPATPRPADTGYTEDEDAEVQKRSKTSGTSSQEGVFTMQDLIDKIRSRKARCGVIGLGYVGLPLALEFARAGFEVTGIDLDQRKVDAINGGQSYIVDTADEEIASRCERARSRATTDFSVHRATCDTINICVPTPLRKTKDPDLTYIVVGAVERDQAAPPPGPARDPREHDLPGHDRRGRAAGARGVGPRGRAGLLSRVLARAHRSGQHAATRRATSRRSSAA